MTQNRRRGRPRLCSDQLLQRVITMRNAGASYRLICDTLNKERVATPAGSARWWPSHVCRLLHTRSAEEFRVSQPGESGCSALGIGAAALAHDGTVELFHVGSQALQSF
jgi:hypothetical protein